MKAVSPSCKPAAAAATCSPLRRTPTPTRKTTSLAPRENRMLDSVRARLTLWYSVALAVVLILLAVLTNILYWRDITHRTESNLVELADAFATTFNAELNDQAGPDAAKAAVRVAMIEHRFRDSVFAFVDSSGTFQFSSLDLPAVTPAREKLSPEIFASPECQQALTACSTSKRCREVPDGKDGFLAYARTLTGAGKNYTLVLLQS